MRVALVYLNNDKLVSRGVGYLLQAARTAGHEVDFYDTAWCEGVADKILTKIYDVVFLSTTSLYWNRTKKIAEAIRAKAPLLPICLGGVHATVDPEECLAECKAINHICIGEGEQFIVDYLDRLGRGEKWPITCRYPPTTLAALPPFNYENWNPKSVIRDHDNLFPGFTYVFATRGCPYRCSYCSNAQLLDLYGKDFLRTQPVETVIEELIHLRDNYPVKLFYFGDEMIGFDTGYCERLFTAVKEQVGIPYGCMFRPETVTPYFVEMLERTGCTYVATGVECGDERFRREYLNRKYTNQRLLEAFQYLRQIPSMFITAFTMKGFPVSFDARLTQATESLLKKLQPDFTQRTWYYPLPGTDLYQYCVDRDLIDWEKVNGREDYFSGSIFTQSIPSHLDRPIYPRSER